MHSLGASILIVGESLLNDGSAMVSEYGSSDLIEELIELLSLLLTFTFTTAAIVLQ